jgi:hypothetical protein
MIASLLGSCIYLSFLQSLFLLSFCLDLPVLLSLPLLDSYLYLSWPPVSISLGLLSLSIYLISGIYFSLPPVSILSLTPWLLSVSPGGSCLYLP